MHIFSSVASMDDTQGFVEGNWSEKSERPQKKKLIFISVKYARGRWHSYAIVYLSVFMAVTQLSVMNRDVNHNKQTSHISTMSVFIIYFSLIAQFDLNRQYLKP